MKDSFFYRLQQGFKRIKDGNKISPNVSDDQSELLKTVFNSSEIRPPFLSQYKVLDISYENRVKIKNIITNKYKFEDQCITNNIWNDFLLVNLIGVGASAMAFLATHVDTGINICIRISAGRNFYNEERNKALDSISSPYLECRYNVFKKKCSKTGNIWKDVDASNEQSLIKKNPKYSRHIMNSRGFINSPAGTSSTGYYIDAIEYLGTCTIKDFLHSNKYTLYDICDVLIGAIEGLSSLYHYIDHKKYLKKGSLMHGDPNLGNLMITVYNSKYIPVWTDLSDDLTDSSKNDLLDFIKFFNVFMNNKASLEKIHPDTYNILTELIIHMEKIYDNNKKDITIAYHMIINHLRSIKNRYPTAEFF